VLHKVYPLKINIVLHSQDEMLPRAYLKLEELVMFLFKVKLQFLSILFVNYL